MATPTHFSKAEIISCVNDVLRIKHPDLTGNLRTYLTASVAASGVTLTVKDTSGWADNDWFILGYPGVPQTEACDVNDADTSKDTSITVTNTLVFAHDVDCPMTRIFERYIEVWGATTLTGSKTAIIEKTNATIIQWDKPYTEYAVGTTYDYYFVRFSDGQATPVVGEYSEGISNTSLASNTVEEICNNALNLVGEKVGNDEATINRKFLLREFNNWQDDVTARRDWSFELVDEQTITSTANTNKYAVSGLTYNLKHPNSDASIIRVRFNGKILEPMKWGEYLESQEGIAYTTLASNTLAAATSCTLTDSYDFAESGTIIIGEDTATYTANAQSTGILTGIGATDFASAHTAGDAVWQGVSPAEPRKYCIYNDNIYFDVPVHTDYAGIKFRISYWKDLTRATETNDTTDIPFYYLGQYFIASRIEYVKGNLDRGNQWMSLYEAKMMIENKKDRQPLEYKFIPQNDLDEIGGSGHFYRSSESSKYNN